MSDDDDVVVDALPLGTRGIIEPGGFLDTEWVGYGGTIVADDEVYSYTVEIDIAGTPLHVQVGYPQFEATADIPIVTDERAIALARTAIDSLFSTRSYLADSAWWARQAALGNDDVSKLEPPPIPVDEMAERDRAIEQMLAAPRDPTVGAGFWVAEKARIEKAGFVAQLDRAALGLPDEADREAILAKLEAGRELRGRYEKQRRALADAPYGDDLLGGTQPVAENPALEAELARDPSNPELYAVYSDWLQGRGDPRGELIALHSGGSRSGRRARRYFEDHARYFCGGFDFETDEDVVSKVEWDNGYISKARVHTTRAHEDKQRDLAKALRAFLALPSARFLQSLEIGCASLHEEGVEQAILEAFVAGGPRPSLRTLRFFTDGEEEMLSWTSTGPLAPIWPLVPGLRKLVVNAGTLQLGVFDLPDLVDLEIETCGLDSTNVDDLLASSITKLERLVLWFGSPERGACSPIAAATALLVDPIAPGIRDFGLVNTEETDALVELLASSPLWPQLRALDLSEGTLTDEGAARLAEALPAAKSLRTLSVGENYLGESGLACLQRPGLEVKSTWQREAELYEGKIYRYCGTPE